MQTTKRQSKVLTLKNVRLSFPNLFEPKASAEGRPKKYSASFIIDPSTKDGKQAIKDIEEEIKEVEKATFGRTGVVIQDPKRRCFQKGDDVTNQRSGEVVTGYAGMMILKASRAESKGPPQVVDRNPKIRLRATDNKPYAGCYGNAMVQIYGIPASDTKRGGIGLFATVEVFQFTNDGEPFGGGPTINAEESLPNVEEVEDEV
jgi:hypothetical protein